MLEGKTAVVTGGSRGIGRSIVERLSRDGVSVVFSYAGNEDAAAEVLRSVEANGSRAHAVRADLVHPDAAEQLMQAAHSHLGNLDILVNNAALAYAPAPLANSDTSDFDKVMAVNTRSVFLTMRYAAKHLRDGGRIVNISTSLTARALPAMALYLASKGAIEQLTAVAAQELGSRAITVNAVSPGPTATDMMRDNTPPEALEAMAAMSPFGRLGQPADLADVVAFLASDDGRWITGQNLRVTGGA
ncbi:3-ketoacyl-ACP reductase [Mycolicibacterium fortuitum]|uniref:glucose 1-dehydrogenase n=1 Tax=Mycolicibacterium fortuitum TaxID=1766 RepID=UPI0007EC8773|nr:glucose 1-dehydrogenase [Mycolicibacterium fortuitum]OBJ99280.1 3-ketoacyl-ACP reductase [Mycolicibacterium fortuitum]